VKRPPFNERGGMLSAFLFLLLVAEVSEVLEVAEVLEVCIFVLTYDNKIYKGKDTFM